MLYYRFERRRQCGFIRFSSTRCQFMPRRLFSSPLKRMKKKLLISSMFFCICGIASHATTISLKLLIECEYQNIPNCDSVLVELHDTIVTSTVVASDTERLLTD